ncbi:RNA polymerase sigma factor [Oligoflexus tunisiensis]|uniref:RNA polymerase sigma factor n=1 Tax=Oligoflexus tunisiensis TaxID=708132 RepID=UPI000B107FE4|nr:sigma-70 family RNA polymerase sigma factor [Oligoflexus tunisiensis]
MNQSPAQRATNFREIYEAHVGLVQFVLRSFRLSEEERDDLVQDVFLRLHQSLDRIDPLKIKGFLSITARNLAIDKVRQSQSRKTEAVGEDIANLEATLWEQNTDRRAVIAVAERFIEEVARQPGGECFGLFYKEGLSVRDIAERLGESTGTITSRLSRMRQKFKDDLARKLAELDGI